MKRNNTVVFYSNVFFYPKIYTEKYLQGKIDYLIAIFTEYKGNRDALTNIVAKCLEKIYKSKINDLKTKNTRITEKLPWFPVLGL